MSRTINDIKQQAVSTYLGMPLSVNFGTPENNYTDADEVGQVVNRCVDDVIEKALRMYPWSFCRKDGVIIGTKEQNPSYEHFSHYANINDYLYRMVPSSATVAQTTGTSLTRLAVNVRMFESAIRFAMSNLNPDSYTYEFFEDMLKTGGATTSVAFQCTAVNQNGGSTWVITGADATIQVLSMQNYGITWYKRDVPQVDDVVTVTYVSPRPEYEYITIQAAFYDPKHWAKCFDWKQYGTNLIKFAPEKLYVEYTIKTDPQYWPAYFADYVACAIAVESCAPLRIESKLPILLQQLSAIYLDARKQDSMGEPTPASFDNIIDEARNIM